MSSILRSLGFADWVLSLLRRLLYAWVRTQVFPQTAAELGLDPARPVCYVLHGRHYSNLLVLMLERHFRRMAGEGAGEQPQDC